MEYGNSHQLFFSKPWGFILSMSSLDRVICITLIGLLHFSGVASASDTTRPKNVVILFSFGTGLPAYDILYQRIRETIQRDVPGPVNIYAEYLDLERFPNESYQQRLFDLYRDKYAEKKIDLLIRIAQGAEKIIEKYGKDLFTNIPTLFLETANPLPQAPRFKTEPFTTGIVGDLDLKSSLETALSLHPATKSAFVITGAAAHDRFLEKAARQTYGDLEARVRIEYLSGLSIQRLLEKATVLPPDSVVIFLSFLCDAEGEYIYSRDLVRMLAEKSNAPVYSVLSTFMGEGVVGGRLLDFPRAGDEAGKLAVRILRGEPVDAIPIVRENYYSYMFDWRQLRRWGISEGKLPADSTVLYKELTFFEQYYWYVVGLTLIGITEAVLLLSLMVLRRKQKKTEKMLHVAEGRYREMLRFERISRLGQLITSLAHELKQPLAAILSSAQATLRFLKADKIDLNLFQQILGNIIRDDKRAVTVITTLQSMVKREEQAKESITLNGVLGDVVAVFMSEAMASNLTIEREFDESLPPILGNPAQLEQVALNLIMNAGDALSQSPFEKKRVVLQTKMTDHAVQVTVRDFGPGIDEAKRDQLFQPFFTTKKSGMGMGLAICKSIIAEHGGRIWAENHPGGGAVFYFELPVPRNES